MLAHTGSPAFPGQRPEQGRDPRFLPGGRQRGAAAGQTGAAGAADGLMVIAGARRNPFEAVLGGEVSGEEAAVLCGAAGRAAGRAQVPEHAGLVTVVRHPAPGAAVTGETSAAVADGGAQSGRGVHQQVQTTVIQVTWKHNRVSVSKKRSSQEICGRKFVKRL